jgi:hypothetical protein
MQGELAFSRLDSGIHTLAPYLVHHCHVAGITYERESPLALRRAPKVGLEIRGDFLSARYRPIVDSPSRFHRYWWDWQRAASRGGTCTRGLRINRPKRQDVYGFSFESMGALASDNE